MATWRTGSCRNQSLLENEVKTFARYLPLTVILLIFLGGYGAAYYWQDLGKKDNAYDVVFQVPQRCRFNADPCVFEIAGQRFELVVEGDVVPLKKFMVTLKNDAVQQASVSFSMMDMDMGINRFAFAKTGQNKWETQVVLPVCSARRKDWVAEFSLLLSGGRKIKVSYPFETQ